jgi:broad specificity phosphatase PhoE
MFLALLAPAILNAFVLQTPPTPARRDSAFFAAVSSVPTAEAVEAARNMMPVIVSEMPEPIPEDLKNKYYFLRHGQSTANVAEIISSSRSLAYSKEHGLTPFGYDQGKESAEQLLSVLESEGAKSGDKVVFVSSPFARAKETAEACLDGLAEKENQARIEEMGVDISNEIVLENKIMERYFGRLDAEAINTYAYVWPLDKFNASHTAFDVESVAAVCTRIREVVTKLEEEYEGHHLVLVSHADVLQIAQLYSANVDNVGIFSSYRFKNGEVRAMKRTPDSLPPPSDLEAPQRGTGM